MDIILRVKASEHCQIGGGDDLKQGDLWSPENQTLSKSRHLKVRCCHLNLQGDLVYLEPVPGFSLSVLHQPPSMWDSSSAHSCLLLPAAAAAAS